MSIDATPSATPSAIPGPKTGPASARPWVVMGVSGSGKTTVGIALAERLGRVFLDGDDLHSAVNVAKMRRGEPLTDEDRRPWLEAVGAWLAEHPQGMVACSALRRRYRDQIRAVTPATAHLELRVPRAELHRRLVARHGHFMSVALLDSQLATWEPLGPDEAGIGVSWPLVLGDVVRRVASYPGG